MNHELLELLRVLEECAHACRMHEKIVAGRLPLTDALRGELAEGLAITATKLERLREELLLRD